MSLPERFEVGYGPSAWGGPDGGRVVGEKRIVVVDDDPSLLRLIAVNLEARGYMPVTFTAGAPALSHMTYATPDLVILNILMPEIDGIEMVRRIRQVSRVPIVMISAKVEVATKLQALHLGADDYLTKPLGIEELIARVRAILRRSTAPGSPLEGTYHWGDLEVDLDRDEVMRRGRPVKLSAREWAVLRIFVRNRGRVVSQRTLLQQAWGPEYGDEQDYVRTYVARLRRKLEPEPGSPRYILTEWGIGYRLVSPGVSSVVRGGSASPPKGT